MICFIISNYCLMLCAFSLWAMTEAVLYYISFQTKTQWVAILNLWAWSNRLQSWCFGPHLALSFIFRNLEIRNKTQTGQSQETKMKTVLVGLLGVNKRLNMMSRKHAHMIFLIFISLQLKCTLITALWTIFIDDSHIFFQHKSWHLHISITLLLTHL